MTDNTELAHVGWGFWGWWVVASTVGLAVGFAVALAVGAVVGEAVGFAMTLAVGGAVLGASVGIAQGLVLRRQVSLVRRRGRPCGWGLGRDRPRARSTATSLPGRWLLASAAGGAVGGAVALAVGEVVGFALTLAIGGAVVGASVGITQWLILRRQVSRAGWWVLASTVGLVVSLGGAVRGVVGGAVAGNKSLVLGGAVTLVAYGAITGSVFVWRLRQPGAKELKQLGITAIRVALIGVFLLGVGGVVISLFRGGLYIGGVIESYLGFSIDDGAFIAFWLGFAILFLMWRFFGERLFTYYEEFVDLFMDLFKD